MQALVDALKPYNCWDGQPFRTGHTRKQYLQKITRFMGNPLVKVLIGQRRTGKSYILRQLMNYLLETGQCPPENLFYFNTEYLAFDSIQTANDLHKLFTQYQNRIAAKGKIYLFLDEIQHITNWERFVNSYAQDFTGEYELFITGSNSQMLSGELSTLLSGRYVEFEIMPFSFNEFADYTAAEKNKESYLQYMQSGGLPELFHLQEEELKRNYLFSLRNTIMLRDIIERNKIKDAALLQDIFLFLMTNVGNLTSITSIVRYFKSKQKHTNYETISSYAGYFTDSFLLHQASRYALKGKKVLGGERKYYLNDLAFNHYLLGFSPDDINYHLENLVYLDLRRAGYQVFVGVLPNKEIDFIAQKGSQQLYIQVAYLLLNEDTIQREFGNLLAISDNYEKIVVSMDDFTFSNYQGIKHLRPWELHRALDE